MMADISSIEDHPDAGIKTGFVYHQDYEEHKPGFWHPECPERVMVIKKAFDSLDTGNKAEIFSPRLALESELLMVHTGKHVASMREMCETSQYHAGMEADLNLQTWQASLRAAGGGIEACRKVMSGEWVNAFCAVRPPGHHATSDSAMGFCMFNNIAIAAAFLLKSGVVRILIVDWDVHHGNGTQEIFYESERVFFYSTHQQNLYPAFSGLESQTGSGKGLNFTLNRPLMPGTSGENHLEIFKTDLEKIGDKFKPDFVLISCGFDSTREDMLGSLNLLPDHYREMTSMVSNMADDRVVSFLEGGYNLSLLGNLFSEHFSGLMEIAGHKRKTIQV